MRNQQKTPLSIILVYMLTFFTLAVNSSINGATIVGGKEAVPYSYPFMVSIQYKSSNRHFCGGALISPQTVITAAHCTKGESANRLKVVLAEHNFKVKEDIEQERDVSEIIIHDDFNYTTLKNDVSILHLSTPVDLGFKTELIALPEPNEEISGTTTVIGWGALSFGGSSPDVLNEVDVDIVDFDQCNTNYNGEILPGMLCASSPGKDACQGDSGGPLFKENKLIGLTSWGKGCAKPNYPGVYTQVSKYIDFISENTLW